MLWNDLTRSISDTRLEVFNNSQMFFLVDKPLGITSFDVLRKMRKILGIKKIGHAGTLDPLASGCMLIATEKSTKLLSLFDGSEKEYVFSICLTGWSESLDAGTQIQSCEYHPIDRTDAEIENYILSQTEQIPPKYSALHIGGKRAYELARSGVEFEIEKRPIIVRSCKILTRTPDSIRVQIRISSGGYVRSFAPVIAGYLGSEGGYISELRRTAVHTQYGSWTEKDLGTLDDPIEKSYNEILPSIPMIPIDAQDVENLKNGCELLEKNSLSPEAHLVFLSYGDTYMSLCNAENGKYTILRNDVR